MRPIRKRRLALLLIESRYLFEAFGRQDATVSPKVSAATIKNLLGSLSLLSSFASKANAGEAATLPASRECDPASRDAMREILEAAEAVDDANQSVDRTARQSVLSFFAAVDAVYRITDDAERTMRQQARKKVRNPPLFGSVAGGFQRFTPSSSERSSRRQEAITIPASSSYGAPSAQSRCARLLMAKQSLATTRPRKGWGEAASNLVTASPRFAFRFSPLSRCVQP